MSHQLRVDWPACRARGLCHEVLPDLVDLDEWGYPLVRGPVTDTCSPTPGPRCVSAPASRSD